mmetsp:Transcript_120307/g.268509  ORF Transcript_120307/g.268509 Transcript_120307/m.268509 type:complete len:234 (+) Transcript_120307:3-704(+)
MVYDGIAYTCSNLQFGFPGSGGALRAVSVSDGKFIWEQLFKEPCVTWPAVGKLPHHIQPTVVVPVGPFPLSIGALGQGVPDWLKLPMNRLDLWLGDYAQWLWRNPSKESEVLAFNAKTGGLQWKYKLPRPYRKLGSHGMNHALEPMLQLGNFRIEETASWGSPLIAGDGTVYGCHMSGYAYTIRDTNGNGVIDPATEASEMYVGAACLHGGHAIGNGMMGFSTIWETFIFKAP